MVSKGEMGSFVISVSRQWSKTSHHLLWAQEISEVERQITMIDALTRKKIISKSNYTLHYNFLQENLGWPNLKTKG